MELPIDHFRLLGVSPSADAEEVLRYFQLRLDRSPHEGFTPEVIAQRSELLRRSADLLCDNAMRQEYESALLGGAVGLEFSTNREVAGLILLWEGGSPYEAFRLAKKALRPPQAPALGSGRELDLTLLASLSCRDAALQEQDFRRYASAAEVLQEGIQLLQRMGKLPEQRNKLERDLEGLLPYRILDLLSRDLSDQKSHEEGLNLLDSYVLKRGGLEGTKTLNESFELTQNDFELFFQQIRNFLTVQEQIDLFLEWQKRGSPDSGFLGAIALVASGFVWRKPELLQKARRQLNSLNLEGFDQKPLLGCIYLLLADVQQAKNAFRSCSDRGLQDWLNNYPGDELAALCDYCRNWLKNDVLQGFRDIDNHPIDLEAWFADRDVQEYIEKIERGGALGFAKAGFTFLSGLAQENSFTKTDNNLSQLDEYPSFVDNENQAEPQLGKEPEEEEKVKFKEIISNYRESLKNRIVALNTPQFEVKLPVGGFNQVTFAFLFVLLLGTSIGWLFIRNRPTQQKSKDPITESIIKTQNKSIKDKKEKSIQVEKDKANEFKKDNNIQLEKDKANQIGKQISIQRPVKFVPLRVANPSRDQVKTLIESWLKGKADILSGVANSQLSIVARPTLVKIVNDQRERDKSLGERQVISTVINYLEIEEQTEKRIAVIAVISYKDKRLDSSDQMISETTIPSLKLKYILGREKKLWQLVDFLSGS